MITMFILYLSLNIYKYLFFILKINFLTKFIFQSVPMFLPIMRGTLNLPAVRDPEVLERLDPNGLLNLCLRYEQHLALCSETVSFEQNNLASRIRDVSIYVYLFINYSYSYYRFIILGILFPLGATFLEMILFNVT